MAFVPHISNNVERASLLYLKINPRSEPFKRFGEPLNHSFALFLLLEQLLQILAHKDPIGFPLSPRSLCICPQWCLWGHFKSGLCQPLIEQPGTRRHVSAFQRVKALRTSFQFQHFGIWLKKLPLYERTLINQHDFFSFSILRAISLNTNSEVN